MNNTAACVEWSKVPSTADLAASRDLFDANLFGAGQVIQAFLPAPRRSDQPRIVIVSSEAGSHGDSQFGLTLNDGATAGYGTRRWP